MLFKRLISLSVALLCCTAVAQAAETALSVGQKINAFSNSADYAFAPATTATAQEHLDAAMTAEDAGEAEKANKAIALALASLKEAKTNALQFRQQHEKVLKLKKSAEIIVDQVSVQEPTKEPEFRAMLQQADDALKGAIGHFESGRLGDSQLAVDEAQASYTEVITKILPDLAERTGAVISKAAGAGAKNYAPVTYERAKAELNSIERFIDGITLTPPTDPLLALTLAERALVIAKQVKAWRKSAGSHEEMLLNARDERLELATLLELEIDSSNANFDISTRELAVAIANLQSELTTEKQARQADQIAFEELLRKQLAEKTASLESERNAELSKIQEAFRAKLERETFEARRQKKLRTLFKDGDVEILVNVDGTVLVRLVALQFASGRSKIDASASTLLRSLKEALDLYGERSARIEGHTDNSGDVKLNQSISLKRAESVRDFLIAAGTDGSRLKALGYGEVRPIASNEFDKGKAMNRRIDIVIEAAHD